jgi:hypothetical protein
VSDARKPLTNAQRQANLRRERDAAGLVEVRNLWAHPGDVDAIRQHARDLAKKRAAGKAAG